MYLELSIPPNLATQAIEPLVGVFRLDFGEFYDKILPVGKPILTDR